MPKLICQSEKPASGPRSRRKDFLFAAGDCLVARGNGSLSRVGRGGLVQEAPDKVAFPDTLIRIRVNPKVAYPRKSSMANPRRLSPALRNGRLLSAHRSQIAFRIVRRGRSDCSRSAIRMALRRR